MLTNGEQSFQVKMTTLGKSSSKGTVPIKITAAFEDVSRMVSVTPNNVGSYEQIFDVFAPVAQASVAAGLNRELSRFCDFVDRAGALGIEFSDAVYLNAASANLGVDENQLCASDVAPTSRTGDACKAFCDEIGKGRKCRIVCIIVVIVIIIVA